MTLTRRTFLHSSLFAAGAALAGCTSAPPTQNIPVALPPTDPTTPLPRSAWTTIQPDPATMRPMNGISMITLYDERSPGPFTLTTMPAVAQHLECLREYQRNSRGYPDIGSHFALDPAGRVWTLRDLRYQGQFAPTHNTHNLGLLLLGNYDLQPLTPAQKSSLPLFLKSLQQQLHLPHPELYTKQELIPCNNPGPAAQKYINMIRHHCFV